METRAVRPEEFEEAGAVTALAYREHGPETSASERIRHSDDGWDEYLDRLADVAGRAEMTRLFVAVEDGRILGTVTLELEDRVSASHGPLEPGQAHVRMLAVHPGARRRGVGRALMERCIQESRAAGKTLLTLHTTERMRAGQRLYEEMEFTRGPDEVHPDGFVLMSYSLPLSPVEGPAGTTSPDASTTPSSHSA